MRGPQHHSASRSSASPVTRWTVHSAHRHRAERAVEPKRRLVPVEHPPFEPREALGPAAPGELPQQRLADPWRAEGRADEQVLEVDAVAAAEGREVVEPQRESGRLAVPFSAMSAKTRGFCPNRAAARASSVASTSSARRSYAASSRTNARTRPDIGRGGGADHDGHRTGAPGRSGGADPSPLDRPRRRAVVVLLLAEIRRGELHSARTAFMSSRTK